MPAFVRVMYKVIYDALYHFAEDDGWAMASHVALSSLLAVFPFLIFGTSLATYLGAKEFADVAVHLIFDTWPAEIAAPISKEVVQVLTIPHSGLLTISGVAAVYFASNGVEAFRVALNRAYRVHELKPWYITRLISLGYVLGAGLSLVALSLLLVVVPLVANFISTQFPLLEGVFKILESWRYAGIAVMVAGGLTFTHIYMPAGRRKLIYVLPGIVLTVAIWVAAAYGFSYYLSTFANYTRTYAGLASIMVVLIFLYMTGVIFLLGAEFNAALIKFRVMRLAAQRLGKSNLSPQRLP